MKHIKLLLQLHSIKLILLATLAVVFLTITDPSSSSKIETPQADLSISNEDASRLAAAYSGK